MLSVLTHWELISSGELIRSEWKIVQGACQVRLYASVVGPDECRSIVGYVEEYRVRVIYYVLCCEHVQGCAVVNDNCDKFKNID